MIPLLVNPLYTLSNIIPRVLQETALSIHSSSFEIIEEITSSSVAISGDKYLE